MKTLHLSIIAIVFLAGFSLSTALAQVQNEPAMSVHYQFSPPNANNQVSFYGIAVALWTGDPQHVTLYSPWESIQADLNVT